MPTSGMGTENARMWAACLLVFDWVPISSGPVRAAMLEAHTWQRWEHGLKSTREYGNPYADVTLRVTYVGPGGRTLRAYGFWDGGDTFRIRCAFPLPGAQQASFVVPNEPGRQVHMILEVTDNGAPPLVAYQRIICSIQ